MKDRDWQADIGQLLRHAADAVDQAVRATETSNSALERILRRAATAAVEEVLARRPVPSAVTLKQAAEMLRIHPNTARKLNLPRNAAGLIPYEVVLAARAPR